MKFLKIIGKIRANPLPVFLLFSFAPFCWFYRHPVGAGDAGLLAFFYNAKYIFDNNWYSWNILDPLHATSGVHITALPIVAVFYLMSLFGLPYNIQQALMYSIALFTSMTFMYLFTYDVFSYRPDKKLIGLISAIFYTYNSFTMILYWATASPFIIYIIPFLPILLFTFNLMLKNKNIAHIFLASAIFSIFSFIFENPAYSLPLLGILASFLSYRVIFNHQLKFLLKEFITLSIKTIIILLFINLWFILPFIFSIRRYFISAIMAEEPLSALLIISKSTDLLSLFRLFPIKTTSGMWAYTNPEWRHFYDNPLFIFTGSLLFILLVLPLLIDHKDKNITFFEILLVIGLFLNKGLNPPFDFVYKIMFENVIFFQSFRSPFKFAPFIIFPSAILLGICVADLSNRLRKKLQKSTIIFLFILIVNVYVFPIWTGSFINTPITIRGNVISAFVEVPDYYHNITTYLNNDSTDYKILSLPLRPSSYVAFNWQYGYDGPDLASLLYSRETISYLGMGATKKYFNNSRILSHLENMIRNHAITSSGLYNTLNIFGLKYIIVQYDVDILHGNYEEKRLISQEELSSLLRQFNVTYISSYGALELYKIPEGHFLPRVYPATNFILINGSIEDMFSVINYENFTMSNTVLFLVGQISNNQYNFLKKFNYTIFIYSNCITIPVYNGFLRPFNWLILSNNQTFEARYYVKSKSVVRTDGKEQNDTISFFSKDECPYKFPSFSPDGWGAYNSTLIYIRTYSEPLMIDRLLEDGKPISDIVGIWWETGWMGMGTSPIKFPIIIPQNQRAIIQVNHVIKNEITLSSLNLLKIKNLNQIKSLAPITVFKKINPTKYVISISNATKPFFLIFSEPFDMQWRAYFKDKPTEFNRIVSEYSYIKMKEAEHEMSFTLGDILYLFTRSLPDELHFMVNGYANAWYINPKEIDRDCDGQFTIILYFWPQNWFYLGLIISSITFIACISYLVYGWKWHKRLLCVKNIFVTESE